MAETRMLTTKECDQRIHDLSNELEKKIVELGPGDEVDVMASKIAIWERVRHHLRKGRIITIDKEEKFQLWTDVPQV